MRLPNRCLPLRQRVDHTWQLLQPGFVPVGYDRLADLVRNVEAHTASLNQTNMSVVIGIRHGFADLALDLSGIIPAAHRFKR